MRRARNLPLAFGIWPLCFSLWAAGTALAGSELDSSVLIPSCIVGAIVSAAVSQLSTGWKKVRAGIFGLLIGAMPSAIGLLLAVFSVKGVDAPIMLLAFSLWLMVPNAIGGALAGLACAQSAPSI